VYCLVAARRRPPLRGVPPGLAGLGPVRLLDVDGEEKRRGPLSTWLAVADAPLDRYGEDAINRGLSDLDWVSRAAVAHEGVIESFIGEPAVLPMKLFTIFASDDRARDHIRRDASRIAALVRRVADHQEWGLRVVLDRAGAAKTLAPAKPDKAAPSGRNFLMRKKDARDRSVELARHARQTIAALFDRLSEHAARAKRRAAGELPVEGGPLLLDAAFLVPAARSSRFRSLVGREARTLGRQGYHVTLTGPWPPYTFVQD
jgi:Gas vesicle synthesis protein GvpL/GvpF